MIVASFALATRPKKPVRARTIPFESGVSAGPPQKQRFTVSFYLTAMLFILFDIEIVFFYPLAVILHELAWFGFFEMLVFFVILALAYVYIWRKGALIGDSETSACATSGSSPSGSSGRPRRPGSSRPRSTTSSRRSG